jgi:type III secretion protein R
MELRPDLFAIIAGVAAVGLVPFAVVTLTAFLKISVVLFLLRNALGTQQTPPNLVLYAIAIILTLYVSAPLMAAIYAAVAGQSGNLASTEGILGIAQAASEPLRAFLERFADPREREFLVQAAQRLWPPETSATLSSDNLIVLVPAFAISELTRAFEIGFLIYLPFIAIDLIVSNVLMAMGMVMVSPLVISVPFKLFVFVLVDGWSRLTHGLLMSYAGA